MTIDLEDRGLLAAGLALLVLTGLAFSAMARASMGIPVVDLHMFLWFVIVETKMRVGCDGCSELVCYVDRSESFMMITKCGIQSLEAKHDEDIVVVDDVMYCDD